MSFLYISAVNYVGATLQFLGLPGVADAVHVGGYLDSNTNLWTWQHGSLIDTPESAGTVWATSMAGIPDQPDNGSPLEECSVMFAYGQWRLGDIPCGHIQPFICESHTVTDP